MSKAADIAKVSATSSFHVLWGLVVSTVISSVATIFVARLLGSDLYGLYGIVLVAPTLIGVFRDWGVNSAMVRYTAQYRGEGRESEVRSIFVSGLIFEIAMGLVLSALSFGLSGFLAADVFHRPTLAPLIELASISILATGIVNAATAAFTGVEKMEHNSIMVVIQSIFKTIIMITLIVQGLGTASAVTGYTAAYAIAATSGILLVYTIYRKLPKPNTRKLEIKAYTKTMLTYGTPVSLASIVSGSQGLFYTFLLPIFYISNNTVIGNYGIASAFVVLITFFATPINTMLFPAFSKLNPEKDKETLKKVFQLSIKYASLLVLPAATLIMCLAQPAVTTLFGSTYSSAPLFLALLALSYVYTAFGSLTAGNFILSQGKTKFNLYLTLLTALIGFPAGYLLIMHFGVLGLIIASLTAGIPSTVIILFWINKHYGLTVEWKSSAKILASSLTVAALTYALVAMLPFSSWISLIIGVIFFAIVFVAAALLTRTVNKVDLENFRGMTSGLGPIGKIINRILNLLEKTITTLKL
jgi:O-antigen/teichoic acid export membrane protein